MRGAGPSKSKPKRDERNLALEWVDALQFAQSLADVQRVSERPFAELLGADYSAICLSSRDDPSRYDWETRLSGPLLSDYAHWAHKDFVLNAVRLRPNVALNDVEMLQGQAVEDTFTYRMSRERGLRLKHVMSVGIVRPGEPWHGGLTLYNERKPFLARRQRLLDWVRVRVENSFWNIRRFGDAHRGQLLEVLSGQEGASLVLTPRGVEKARTSQATALLLRRFGSARVPSGWLERLALLEASRDGARGDLLTLEEPGPDAALHVRFIRLPPVEGRTYWEVSFREHANALPRGWREVLTPRQIEVANLLLQGYSNQEIVDALGCGLETVKVHVRDIRRAVGADHRMDFVVRALSRR